MARKRANLKKGISGPRKMKSGSFLEPDKELKFGGISKYRSGTSGGEGVKKTTSGYSGVGRPLTQGGNRRKQIESSMQPKNAKPIDSGRPKKLKNTDVLENTKISRSRHQEAVDTTNKQWGEGFSAAFAEARRRGKTTFTFKGRSFGTRKKGESKAEHEAAMKRSRPQSMKKKAAGNIDTGVEGPKLQASRVTVPQTKSRKERRQENKSKRKNSTSSVQTAASPKYSKSSGKSMKGKYSTGTPGGVKPSGRNQQMWDESSGMSESEFYRKQGEMAEGARDFDQAFAAARRAGKSTFTWRGKSYGTRKAGESKASNNSRNATASVTRGKTATSASTGKGKSVKTLLSALDNVPGKTSSSAGKTMSKGKDFSKAKSAPPAAATSQGKTYSKSAPGKSMGKMTDRRVNSATSKRDERRANREDRQNNRKARRTAVRDVRQSYKR